MGPTVGAALVLRGAWEISPILTLLIAIPVGIAAGIVSGLMLLRLIAWLDS